MVGAVILVVVLLAFPLIVGIGGSVIAAVLGIGLQKNGEASHPDSEFLDLNT